jgi:hypothetical protein
MSRAFAGMATAIGPSRIGLRDGQAPLGRPQIAPSNVRVGGRRDRSRFSRTCPSLTHHNREHNRKWNIYCRNFHF